MSYVVWLIFFFVVIMVGGVIGILRYQRARKKILSDKVMFLKEYGKKLDVLFASCDVVHRQYYEEDEKGEKIQKDISIITFETEIDQQKIVFSTLPIFLGDDALRSVIAGQEKTKIYYDSSNPGIYYFDVEFLKISTPKRREKEMKS